jgi:hypothetical protein
LPHPGGRADDAVALHRLYATATPAPSSGSSCIGSRTGNDRGCTGGCPAAPRPILRFADVEGYVQAAEEGGSDGTLLDAFVQIGVAKEDQPHYLKVLARPDVDVSSLVDFGLGVISERLERGSGHRLDHGVVAPVRTYEAPVDRRLEEAGFETLATVTLLLKETLVRVAEPALVPAGVR